MWNALYEAGHEWAQQGLVAEGYLDPPDPADNPAGRCMGRMAPGRILATYHDRAPDGGNVCTVCHRWVIRGHLARIILDRWAGR